MNRFGYDITNGTVIGKVSAEYHYTFHADKTGICFASENFKKDSDAEKYVKDNWHDHFVSGVEIRCYEERS